MFLEGKIKTYNEERGFGFIEIEGESKDLFFHIKDFPNKNVPPKVGESLKFLKVQDAGKFKANNIVRLDLKTETPRLTTQSRFETNKIQRKNNIRKTDSKKEGFNFINILIGIIMISIFSALFIPFISGIYQRETLKRQNAQATNTSKIVDNSQTGYPEVYSCDGRKHCSEMKSYEEAVFFINHCPGTMMDGDGDGIPCESQFR